jgi:hypothetical protein
MLSATSLGHGAHGLAVAEAHYETHWINGEQVTLVADPAFDGPLDSGGSGGIANGALHPLTSLPQLSSNPGATAKLYLDFDGHFEPQWGTFTNVTTPVYDIDSDLATFSDAELANIYSAWQTVAEDYAPFNIDVTTVEPPELAPGVPDSVANGVAVRIAIGGDNSWLGVSGSSGYAFIGSFTNSQTNTAYVFPRSISADLIRAQQFIGDIASHEAGHTFGLSHQNTYDLNGNKIEEYNSGDGIWAPVMGYVYTAKTRTWHNGASGSATTFQDDLAVIANGVNGFGYRADDHGNTLVNASALSTAGVAWVGSGTIETNSDVDVFSFTVSNDDTYHFAVDPAPTNPNLDAIMELRDAAGTLITAAAPAASLGASLSASLAAGTYFVAVSKVIAYGWVGAYTLNVTQPPAGITVNTTGPLVVPERGSTSFGVVLDAQPTADVNVPLSVSNPGQATLSVSSVTFTPTNWNVPQTVVATGSDDGSVDGDVTFTIVLGAATSTDAEYGGLDPNDLPATSTDHAYGGFAYWVDRTSDLIQRAPLNGGPVETLLDLKTIYGGVSQQYSPRALAIDSAGGKMYWTDQTADRIQRANLDGSNVETIVSGLVDLLGIELDTNARKMYWVDAASQKIQRANLDGSAVQDVITSQGGLWDLAIDTATAKIYWGNMNDNSIRRANLDGSGVELLWTGGELSNLRALALDLSAGKLYWADSGTQQILRANLNGTSPEVIADGSVLAQSPLWWMTVDSREGKIYWTDLYRDTLFRMNLDGSGATAVINGLNDPQGVAIVAPTVIVTPNSGLVTNESGVVATFQVTLTTPPNANVTIPVSSSDPTEGSVSTASLTFTPANWKVPQTVTVTGVNDTIFDGDIAYTVILGAATSSDPTYTGVNPRDVSLTNLDNEVKFYVVNDATTNLSYKYGADGSARGNTALGAANTAPRGVASTILGDKTWVIDANRNVYVYSTSTGALLGSWAAGSLAGNATPEGIATNGADVWIVDSRSDKVFRYTGAASRLSGSQTAASSFSLASGNPKDIVTDGASLWVVDDASKTDKVFKYSLAGSLTGSWTIDSANKAPTGITIDPANVSHIWIVDSGTDRVYQYTGAATRTSGSQSAALSFALAAGNTNPQGIADPPAPETIVPANAVTTDIDVSIGRHLLKLAKNWTDGNGRVLTDDKSFTTSIAGSSRPVHSARFDLLLARQQVFDAFDQKRLDALDGATVRTINRQRDELEFVDCFKEHNAKSVLAIDAVFAKSV